MFFCRKTQLHSNKKFPLHFHPQRFCQVFFIIILLTSQVVLSLFVLKLYHDVETIKLKQVTTWKDGKKEKFT